MLRSAAAEWSGRETLSNPWKLFGEQYVSATP
jgi:hypothetical protein